MGFSFAFFCFSLEKFHFALYNLYNIYSFQAGKNVVSLRLRQYDVHFTASKQPLRVFDGILLHCRGAAATMRISILGKQALSSFSGSKECILTMREKRNTKRNKKTQSPADFLREFGAGTAIRAFDFLGCHKAVREGVSGYVFRTWAPRAEKLQVAGDFNFWNPEDLPMQPIGGGVWEAFSPFPKPGQAYKYVVDNYGRRVMKADPYGVGMTPLPDTSSLIPTDKPHVWKDKAWMDAAGKKDALHQPMNIYEVHLGSWRRKEDGTRYTYAELAELLPAYVMEMGYTHVEFTPLSEYPFEPSWGYQVSGYFAPTARYGDGEGLKLLVDKLHQAGIGVLLDWVPAHFPKDEYGLYEFDGSCTYELSDPMMNEHPDWTTRIFDFGRPEVKSFLVSNAVYWLTQFHFDGLRVDAVSSMLYLDYNRSNYRPNRYGGRENLEAIELLRAVNRAAFAVRPGAIMVAEESTTFPMVTKPDFDGGLGFLFKWNMGWMNDLLKYMKEDPLFRKYHHSKLTFSLTYAFSENFILPLSHDEVVHGKCSLVNKMPGDYDQKFNNLRAMLGFMFAHPGKKLNFMGNEFGQFIEWRFDRELDWLLLDYDRHRQCLAFSKKLNHFYLENTPLWDDDCGWDGFQWIEPNAADQSIYAFRRIDREKNEVIAIFNFCPVPRPSFRLGVPVAGTYTPVLNSDEIEYGGTGMPVSPKKSEPVSYGSYLHSCCFDIPPMSATFYTCQPDEPEKLPAAEAESIESQKLEEK